MQPTRLIDVSLASLVVLQTPRGWQHVQKRSKAHSRTANMEVHKGAMPAMQKSPRPIAGRQTWSCIVKSVGHNCVSCTRQHVPRSTAQATSQNGWPQLLNELYTATCAMVRHPKLYTATCAPVCNTCQATCAMEHPCAGQQCDYHLQYHCGCLIKWSLSNTPAHRWHPHTHRFGRKVTYQDHQAK